MGWIGGGFASMWIMGFFGLVTLAGIIVLLVWANRAVPTRHGPELGRSPEPLAQLQLRLARGEITPDECEVLRAHLRD